MRGWRQSPTLDGPLSGELVVHGGYDLLPDVRMIPDGELFAGTWIIARCSFGRAVEGGYEVRSLSGDNDHFATRREAVEAAFLRAIRTVDVGEVDARHLSSVPSAGLRAGRR